VSARARRVLSACALVTIACNAIVGNESITYVEEDGGVGIDGESPSDARADVIDAADDTLDASVPETADVLVPPCKDIDSALCSDFDPPLGPPKYGFQTATTPALPTNATTFTTEPFSVDVAAAPGGADRSLGFTLATPVNGRWEVDVEVLEVPNGAAVPSAVILRFLCTSTDTVSIRLRGRDLELEIVRTGGVETRPGPTLPLASWRHLAVDIGATNVALMVDGTSTFSSESCNANLNMVLGVLDNAAGGTGQWRILFDSFRFYR
jgi:hypothetical protein